MFQYLYTNSFCLQVNWLWIDAYSTLALLLPITIGGIGVRDGSLVGAMSLLNIESYKALSVSMILFIVQVIRALVGLVIYLLGKNKWIGDYY